jgi:hypothetical protein
MWLLTVRQWIQSDALKGQNILALGCGPKMIPFPFLQSGLARLRRAKPDCKKERLDVG